MPSKSPAQAKLMKAIAGGWKMPGGRGPSPEVAKDFVTADKKAKRYQLGGLAGMTGIGPMVRRAVPQFPAPESIDPYSGVPGLGGYQIPRPSSRTGTDFDPGSIAEQIYNKYGIVDPTATGYDRTSEAELKEDPYAYMAPDDPARQQYERWDFERTPTEDAGPVYADMPGKKSEYRDRLRESKAKIAGILGSARGGAVGYQSGGLAAMRGQRQGNRMRGAGQRRAMPQRGPMAQLGGPGGMPGGQGQMITPDNARMPGGRAMPLRGFQQKQAMLRRGNLGGNRVGQSDQQGGLARALQRGTGRPPMSRRSAFPGR